jgi:GT2 family glycosyltransferase
MRAREIGYQGIIAENSFVYHKGSSTFSKEDGTRELIRKNKQIFRSKHPKSKLIHVRLDAYNTIIWAIKEIEKNKKNEVDVARIRNRLQLIQSEMPKSLHKKIEWKIKIKIIEWKIRRIKKDALR